MCANCIIVAPPHCTPPHHCLPRQPRRPPACRLPGMQSAAPCIAAACARLIEHSYSPLGADMVVGKAQMDLAIQRAFVIAGVNKLSCKEGSRVGDGAHRVRWTPKRI